MDGPENPYALGQQMGDLMIKSATVVKHNPQLDAALAGIQEFKERWKRCNVLDTGRTVNQSAAYVNQLWNMLEIAHLILKASRMRDESRGSHYKPEFVLPKPKTPNPKDDPEFMAAWKARNDKWLKTTMGTWTPDGPRISYEELRSLKNPILSPEPRHYD
jgi:succinate dehydrogenase / fumarate reductase flavoprotein subunit